MSPATGEHPQASPGPPPAPETHVTPNSKLSLGIVIPLLGIAAAAGVALFQIRSVDSDFRDHKRESDLIHREATGRSHSLELRHVAVESDLRAIRDSIGDMNKKLDQLVEQRGTRQAGGR